MPSTVPRPGLGTCTVDSMGVPKVQVSPLVAVCVVRVVHTANATIAIIFSASASIPGTGMFSVTTSVAKL